MAIHILFSRNWHTMRIVFLLGCLGTTAYTTSNESKPPHVKAETSRRNARQRGSHLIWGHVLEHGAAAILDEANSFRLHLCCFCHAGHQEGHPAEYAGSTAAVPAARAASAAASP